MRLKLLLMQKLAEEIVLVQVSCVSLVKILITTMVILLSLAMTVLLRQYLLTDTQKA